MKIWFAPPRDKDFLAIDLFFFLALFAPSDCRLCDSARSRALKNQWAEGCIRLEPGSCQTEHTVMLSVQLLYRHWIE